MVLYTHAVTFKAPIKFVYGWCTDYQESDPQIIGANYRRIILEKSKKKVVYASCKVGYDGSPKLAVRIVSLFPSKFSWHLDYIAEEDLETGEYRLTKLGKELTRLGMRFKNTWKNGSSPSTEYFRSETKSGLG
jgi:hypothetical protein